jgi:exonuclease SbcD
MRCSFVQFGDVHLGTLQYDSVERLNDFGRAWLYTCNYIAEAKPDFAICTGDLFNRFTINPITFEQAFAGLRQLREAGVPIVDVMGNHDRTRYNEARSWLHTFADQGLLTLLDVETRVDGVALHPVDPARHTGGYVDWSGCRIIGARYLGASTDSILQTLDPELTRLRRDGMFTILVLHAGLEGIVPNFNAELTAAGLERLRDLVDYVALGHIHKHYAVGNFAFNAGSLETWAMNEWAWDRGLLHVQIDTETSPTATVQRVDVPRRPFRLMRVDVGEYKSPKALLRGCFERLQLEQRQSTGDRPVAVLTLHGRLRFDARDVPVNLIENACKQILDPLVTQVREQYDSREFSDEGSSDEDEIVDRAVIERDVLRARFALDDRYAASAIGLAQLTTQLKERALQDNDGPGLLQLLREGLVNLRSQAQKPTASPAATEPNGRSP